MTRIKFSENGNTAFEKLIGHNPEILKNGMHWKKLYGTTHRWTIICWNKFVGQWLLKTVVNTVW